MLKHWSMCHILFICTCIFHLTMKRPGNMLIPKIHSHCTGKKKLFVVGLNGLQKCTDEFLSIQEILRTECERGLYKRRG